MESIRIKNLRALKDTGDIKLKPLTVLVGKNSSGKSTFLRFFPLLKQSFTRTTNEPVLWYEQTGVDFGSYNDSINKKIHSITSRHPVTQRRVRKEVSFMEFTFKVALNKIQNFYIRSGEDSSIKSKLSEYMDITMKLRNKNIHELCLKFGNLNIRFIENQDEFTYFDNSYSLYINDHHLLSNLVNISYDSYDVNKILPTFRYKSNPTEKTQLSKVEKPNEISIRDLLEQKIITDILQETNSSTDRKTLNQLHKDLNIVIDQYDDDFTSIIHLANFSSEFTKYITQKISSNHEFFSHIFDSITYDYEEDKVVNGIINYLEDPQYSNKNSIYMDLFGCCLDPLLEKVNYYLNLYFSNVHYIAPVRASAERYYRTQGLSVNEIDPRGDNIPFALNYLSKKEKKEFQQWTNKNFDFYFDTEEKFGHINLNIHLSNKDKINLTDTGFGFSQILPIVLLIWNTESKENYESQFYNFFEKTIVIEQPELHLHPALQAKLLDVLINCINVINNKKENEVFNIIIETHSETIINRIGQSIYSEKINAEDVNLLVFDNIDAYESKIINVYFDEKGILNNWPLGFFYPEV